MWKCIFLKRNNHISFYFLTETIHPFFLQNMNVSIGKQWLRYGRTSIIMEVFCPLSRHKSCYLSFQSSWWKRFPHLFLVLIWLNQLFQWVSHCHFIERWKLFASSDCVKAPQKEILNIKILKTCLWLLKNHK